jgi:hypothetical protein
MSTSSTDYQIAKVRLDEQLFNTAVTRGEVGEEAVAVDSEGREAVRYVPDSDPASSIHYNLRTLSYSGVLTLHSCPRKFELSRLQPRDGQDDEAGHLNFGTVVGNGIQEYLVSGSLDRAIFRAFADWNDNLESDRGLKHHKTFWHAVYAVQSFVKLRSTQLAAYDLVSFNGKPAIELGFSVSLPGGFKYRGKLDALLIHRTKQEYLVLECKTTGMVYVDEANYKNSNQAIGYGVVIDAVASAAKHEGAVNSYDVLYPVYMTKQSEWAPFKFRKTNTQRALWLQSLLLETWHIQQYSDLGYFPTHGESCLSFNRQCAYYGTCQIANKMLVGDTSLIEPKLDKIGEYPLEFSMEELIAAQLEKVDAETQ